eukprot:TRINITY_DN5324_c0_g1_i1.p1 TRINITY_DN5324_c0_g1~~TRINITY_DN5324_c0_g1_i1.p1  ORF type:complete len:307 (-),score=47.86 TRINITY_DN5324_c0_g1_i1:62-982(-)
MSLDIVLDRVTRVYQPGESVKGVVVVTSKGNSSHNGLSISMNGQVSLQLSAKSVGLFEAFYNSLKPITLFDYPITIAKTGKLKDGNNEFPFEFKLEPLEGQQLFETYHGVYVNIQYLLKADMVRPLFGKNLTKNLEFVIEIPPGDGAIPQLSPETFNITPDKLDNIKKNQGSLKVPNFKITGKLDSSVCVITQPFSGTLKVEDCDSEIKSIELQLVRVETCGCADGFAKEPTEIQNIQIADGDIVRGIEIPIFMIFPRLFTCPTVASRTFKIDFEVNLVVMFTDGRLVTEKFPIKLVRGTKDMVEI